MSARKKIQILLTAGFLLSVPMSYNSCSAKHEGGESGVFNTSSKACGLDNFFQRSWSPFLQSKCATCHISGGPGKGAFADNNVVVAYNAFNLAGFSKVGRFAVNPSHNPPYSGPANKDQVDALLADWLKAETEAQENCGETDEVADGRIDEDFTKWMRTRSQGINASAVADTSTLEFELGQDMLPANLPDGVNLSGAKVRVTVEVRNNLGDIYYAIYDPVLDMTDASEDLRLSGIAVILNGQVIDDQTTFFRVDASRRDGDGPNPILSSGAMIIQGTTRTTDTLALTFKELENIDLGPRPAGIMATLDRATMTVQERGTHQLTVNLSEPVLTREVAVEIGFPTDGSALPPRTGVTVENEAGVDVEIRNYDWDFDLPVSNVIFQPGETSKTIDFLIQDDARDEFRVVNGSRVDNEQFQFNIAGVVGGLEIGNQNRTRVTITDDDAPRDPSSTTPSYSDLMSPDGVFQQWCIKCHNSEDQQGGYDITNYQQMLASGVLVPGQPLFSQMYTRLNLTGTGRMPVSSQLDISLRREVEKWIEDGAKND